MSVSTLLAALDTLAPVVAVAPIAPIAPIAPVSFRFWSSKEPRFIAELVADLYAVKGDGYVEALFAAVESAGVAYRAPGFKLLIKVYSGKIRVNQMTIGNPLSRRSDESITAWLDRVSFNPSVKAIGFEMLAEQLTQAQVKSMHKDCAPCKFDSEATNGLVGSFTFIAPPTLPAEVKQFTRTEHVEHVALPALTVPAGHVEPPAPVTHVEFVGDAPAFAVEPIVADVAVEADDSVEVVMVDDLERRTLSELRLICKKEFGFPSPSKITHRRLVFLIEAMRAAS